MVQVCRSTVRMLRVLVRWGSEACMLHLFDTTARASLQLVLKIKSITIFACSRCWMLVLYSQLITFRDSNFCVLQHQAGHFTVHLPLCWWMVQHENNSVEGVMFVCVESASSCLSDMCTWAKNSVPEIDLLRIQTFSSLDRVSIDALGADLHTCLSCATWGFICCEQSHYCKTSSTFKHLPLTLS